MANANGLACAIALLLEGTARNFIMNIDAQMENIHSMIGSREFSLNEQNIILIQLFSIDFLIVTHKKFRKKTKLICI